MQTVSVLPENNVSWFNQHKAKPFATNNRFAIRFKRDDIVASVKKLGFVVFGSVKEVNFVKLLDISSRGVAIATPVKLSMNNRVLLTLSFVGLESFEIPCRVVRVVGGDRPIYGLKFDAVNNPMANLLVNTKRLEFR